VVFAGEYWSRHGDVGIGDRVRHAVLAEDVVCRIGGFARRRPPDNELAVAPGDEQGLVRVSFLMAGNVVVVDLAEVFSQIRDQRVLVDEALVVVLAHGCDSAVLSARAADTMSSGDS